MFITIIPRRMNMHMSACIWLFAYCLCICNELYNLVLAIGGIAEKSSKHLRGDYSAVGGPLCFEPCKSKHCLKTHRNRGVNTVYASHREDFGLVCRTVSGGHEESFHMYPVLQSIVSPQLVLWECLMIVSWLVVKANIDAKDDVPSGLAGLSWKPATLDLWLHRSRCSRDIVNLQFGSDQRLINLPI